MTGLQPLILIAPIALVLFAGAVAYRFVKTGDQLNGDR
jgi:hypothetical protein